MPRLLCCFCGKKEKGEAATEVVGDITLLVGDVDGGAFEVFQTVCLEELQTLLSFEENKQKLVVVYCYLDRCGACKEMTEKLRKVVADYKDDKGVRFVGVEVGCDMEVKKVLGVSHVPIFKLYHAGGLMDTAKHDVELREVIRNFKIEQLEKAIKPGGGETLSVEAADSSVMSGAKSPLSSRSLLSGKLY